MALEIHFDITLFRGKKYLFVTKRGEIKILAIKTTMMANFQVFYWAKLVKRASRENKAEEPISWSSRFASL